MPEKVFIGNAFSSGTSNPGTDTHYVNHFTSAYSGMLTKLGMYSNAAGNIKLNIYDTVSSIPTNLLCADDTGISCTGGQANYVDISASTIIVQSGTLYGLGGITDTSGTITYNAQAGARTYKSGLTYATFVAPDPISGYTTQDPTGNVYSFVAYGWEPPAITISSDDTIENGQTGVTLTGTDFMDTGATLELCDGPVYATATKVTQTVTNQTDTSLEFTVVRGGLSLGTSYLFVTTSLGQINATGYEVTLIGYPAISDVDPLTIRNNDSFTVTGTNFGVSGATLYIGDNSDYSTANKYTCNISSESDTEIVGVMDNEGAFYGSGWIYVKESGGAYNTTGYAVTITEPSTPIVFYGETPGFGNNAFGRQNYGGMATDMEPRFIASVPADDATDVSVLMVSMKTSIYGFSSSIYDVHVEISEDGAEFVDAYVNGSFFAPYNGPDSWIDLHQADPQLAIVKVEKTVPWNEDIEIIVRITAMDQFGNEATKDTVMEW